MTLHDAIERLKEERQDHHSLSTDLTGQALVLALEAMAFLKMRRGAYKSSYNVKLPSETEF